MGVAGDRGGSLSVSFCIYLPEVVIQWISYSPVGTMLMLDCEISSGKTRAHALRKAPHTR